MTPAAEALASPRARLSPEEAAAADALEASVEAHVAARMERRGCDGFRTEETRPNVVAEVNLRLVAAGWVPQWEPLARQGLVGQGPVHAGFQLSLAPSREAYAAADRAARERAT